MYVCIRVCIYVYIYVDKYVYIYLYMSVCAYLCIHIYVHIHTHARHACAARLSCTAHRLLPKVKEGWPLAMLGGYRKIAAGIRCLKKRGALRQPIFAGAGEGERYHGNGKSTIKYNIVSYNIIEVNTVYIGL